MKVTKEYIEAKHILGFYTQSKKTYGGTPYRVITLLRKGLFKFNIKIKFEYNHIGGKYFITKEYLKAAEFLDEYFS